MFRDKVTFSLSYVSCTVLFENIDITDQQLHPDQKAARLPLPHDDGNRKIQPAVLQKKKDMQRLQNCYEKNKKRD